MPNDVFAAGTAVAVMENYDFVLPARALWVFIGLATVLFSLEFMRMPNMSSPRYRHIGAPVNVALGCTIGCVAVLLFGNMSLEDM